MELECLTELDGGPLEEWTRFLRAAERQHPHQDPGFAAIERAAGHKPLFVIGRVDGTVRVVGLFALTPHWASRRWSSEAVATGGPVSDDLADLEAFLSALVKHPAFKRVGRVTIFPYWLNDDARRAQRVLDRLGWRTAEEAEFRGTGLIALNRSDEEILASFSKSARREVRRAERQGIEVVRMEEAEEWRVFFASLSRMRRRKGLRLTPAQVWEAWFSAACSDDRLGTIFAARKEGIFVAGLLVIRSPRTVHARFFTTEPEALHALSNLRMAPLLWWKAMVWGREQGCRWLEVGPYQAGMPKTDPMYSVNKYKGEFNPIQAVRISGHSVITNRLLYGHVLMVSTAKRWVKRRLPGVADCLRSLGIR